MAGELTPHEGDLEPDEEYDGALFADALFTDITAGNCHFLDCEFVNASFDGGRLRKSRFTDTRVRDTRFVAGDLAETGWLDTSLTGCALAGVQAFSASIRSGTFSDVRFENCLLRDTQFGGATLLRVSFGGCTLIRADFARVSCTDVDLRGAALGITAGYESLRGATIDSVQLVTLAPLLAGHLGITVAD
jgi:uncharacterized protein YjbI with pentapeptide repeats